MQTIPFKRNFFADDEEPARAAALEGDVHADVVIVGGGLVGLSCAYTLREEGLEVALVERNHVGSESSGRHLGHLTPHMWHLPKEGADVLAGWAQGCLDVTEERLAAEGIECGFERVPYWMPAVHEADARGVTGMAKYYSRLGLDARAVAAEDFDLVSFRTFGAVVLERQGRVNPYRMMRGLREAVLRRGVRLYEDTPAVSIEGGKEVCVKTPNGTVRAPKAILALNAFSVQFSFLQKYVASAHTYAIATEVLDEETVRSLGPAAAEEIMIFDFPLSESPSYYQRLRRDGRIIFGGGTRPLSSAPDEIGPDENQDAFQDIHREMVRRYPTLEKARVELGWGGSVSRPSTNAPIIAELPEHENVILAVIGNGNGVGLGANAGALVKGLVLGKDRLDGPTRTFLEYCSGLGS